MVGFFGAQGGIRTRNALENYSSVARVTAVHTLGRLPQAADRAILPLRTPFSRNRARARHTCPGQSYSGKAGKLKPSQRKHDQGLLPDTRRSFDKDNSRSSTYKVKHSTWQTPSFQPLGSAPPSSDS